MWGWTTFADSNNHGFEVDLNMVAQTFASRANNEIRLRRTNVVPLTDGRLLAFNHNGARAEIHARVQRDMAEFEALRFRDGMAAFRSVVRARTQAVRAQQRLLDRYRRVGHAISEDVDRRVNRAIAAVNISSTVLITASVLIPNPIGAGVALGAGSVMAGMGTYGETNSVGAALLSGTTSLVVGVIPFGLGAAGFANQTALHAGTRALTRGESMAVFFVGSQVEASANTAIAITSGESTDRAIVNALSNTAFGAVAGQALGSARRTIGNAHIPVALRSSVESVTDIAVAQGTSSAGSAFAGRATSALMGSAPGAGIGPSTTTAGSTTSMLLNGRRRPSCNDMFQENYVMLFAMRPVLAQGEPIEGWWRDLGALECA